MKSPAQRHRERMTAQAAGTSPAADHRAQDQHQVMRAGLWQLKRDLKDKRSLERKIEYKRDKALPQLMDYVDGVIAALVGGDDADQGGDDEIVATAMVWLFDVGNLYDALRVADYVVGHGLAAPDQYKRDAITIVAEETAERVFDRLKETPDADALKGLAQSTGHAERLVGDADIHDEVRAKLHKAAGYVARDLGALAQARGHLRRALGLHDKIGVKKDIERLETDIKKMNTTTEAEKSEKPGGGNTPAAGNGSETNAGSGSQ